jgi:membrane-associated PAP2 superfamily phosphatase
VWLHVALIPAALGLLGWLASTSGIDRTISNFFYDPAVAHFPAHDNFWLDLFGHRIAKAAIWIVAICVLVAAVGAKRVWPAGAGTRRALWIALFAMALGPTLVFLLKQTTGHHCPWDLTAYGGFANATFDWFVAPIDAGHCFPSGHASAGYSLVALAFLGKALDRPRFACGALIATVVVGTAFSAVRVVQGAHFVSHNVWAAAIDWCAAALVFTPLLGARR